MADLIWGKLVDICELALQHSQQRIKFDFNYAVVKRIIE